MRTKFLTLVFLLLPFIAHTEDTDSQQSDSTHAAPLPPSESVIKKIAIGSCHNQKKPAPIWKAITEASPQLILLLGDNIYSDTHDPEEYRSVYKEWKKIRPFKSLFTSIPMLFIWDDHDYGKNDEGRDDHPTREQIQRVFLEELYIPTDRRAWQSEGIYDAYIFGPENKRLQIILLDTRTFRSPLSTHPYGKRITPSGALLGKYIPTDDYTTTILGEAQWQWLEEQLRIPAQIRLIASSIQVLSNEHGWECWGNFPHERQRLLRLIRDTHAEGVILLSGDRHMAEFSRLPVDDPLSPGYPITEFTSSSLNMSGFKNPAEPNPYRIPETKQITENNFGLIDIDWDSDDPLITLSICSERNKNLQTIQFPLSSLQITSPTKDVTNDSSSD
ncbi:MAG: alkaline phosphatase family protein [Methylacidiphilales bacterium]|nr:alkaline phosphatase family protein [Candidatus Methylacidiphilales bacterium]MDW8348898.1 alkaline phosphatase D family protein [Verrucomicrobiae bacterium]